MNSPCPTRHGFHFSAHWAPKGGLLSSAELPQITESFNLHESWVTCAPDSWPPRNRLCARHVDCCRGHPHGDRRPSPGAPLAANLPGVPPHWTAPAKRRSRPRSQRPAPADPPPPLAVAGVLSPMPAWAGLPYRNGTQLFAPPFIPIRMQLRISSPKCHTRWLPTIRRPPA